MKKKSTRIIALIMVLMMIVPMCVMPASAKTVGKPKASISASARWISTLQWTSGKLLYGRYGNTRSNGTGRNVFVPAGRYLSVQHRYSSTVECWCSYAGCTLYFPQTTYVYG